MRNTFHETRRLAACLVIILPGVLSLGCDRPSPLHPEVSAERRILGLVEDVDDFAQTASEHKRILRLFAPGCAPPKEALPRYAAYHYEGKQPVPSGDSATVTVIIKDAQTGASAGEVQWSAAKINDAWKLKDAPLPAAAH